MLLSAADGGGDVRRFASFPAEVETETDLDES